MKYEYGAITFHGSILDIQGQLRNYLLNKRVYLRAGKLRVGLESVPVPTKEECVADLVELMIKNAVYQVEQCSNSLQYMDETFHGSWNDIYRGFKLYLESLPLKYITCGSFELGLLSIYIHEDLSVEAIKEKLVTLILRICRNKYKEKYDV